MNNQLYMKTKYILFGFTLLIFTASYAQKEDLKKSIQQHDSIFWAGYNECNLAIFEHYITEDFEFYHDKGGLTSGKEAFLKSIQENLCGAKKKWKLRRKETEGTIRLYPLNNYGAILKGEHVFYLMEEGKNERLIEKAQFTHVWQNENGVWRMSRVLSFDHQPVSQNSHKQGIILSNKELSLNLGNYKAPKTGDVTISLVDDTLMMNAGTMKAKLFPESNSLFFMKQAPLTFEFIKDETGKVHKMVVREQGKVVEEAIKQ